MSYPTITAVLGAGASRGVSYRDATFPSPLDFDFFDLLQRLPANENDKQAIAFVLTQAMQGPERLWDSLEKCFYTLVIRAQTRKVIFGEQDGNSDEEAIRDYFSVVIHALLRAAHKKMACTSHRDFLSILGNDDAVITFNYDLVAERALMEPHVGLPPFGRWLYGFEKPPNTGRHIPTIHKLHGSSNWFLKDNEFQVAQKNWNDFAVQPGYMRKSRALLLPFWDKKIEEPPWSDIWKRAASQLKKTDHLIVWGYSLPLTDLKARELFRAGMERAFYLSVIDPSRETKQRWRGLFPHCKYWPYDSIEEFLNRPPSWWKKPEVRPAVEDFGRE